jgi:hypothetical protein
MSGVISIFSEGDAPSRAERQGARRGLVFRHPLTGGATVGDPQRLTSPPLCRVAEDRQADVDHLDDPEMTIIAPKIPRAM